MSILKHVRFSVYDQDNDPEHHEVTAQLNRFATFKLPKGHTKGDLDNTKALCMHKLFKEIYGPLEKVVLASEDQEAIQFIHEWGEFPR